MSRSSKPSPFTSPAFDTEPPLSSFASAPKIVNPAEPRFAKLIVVNRQRESRLSAQRNSPETCKRRRDCADRFRCVDCEDNFHRQKSQKHKAVSFESSQFCHLGSVMRLVRQLSCVRLSATRLCENPTVTLKPATRSAFAFSRQHSFPGTCGRRGPAGCAETDPIAGSSPQREPVDSAGRTCDRALPCGSPS